MANNFDEFPIYDPFIKEGTLRMSDVWADSMATFYQTLITYLGQYGVFLPNLTDAERAKIQSPQLGQMIYNTTANAPQIYQAGAWKTFTTS